MAKIERTLNAYDSIIVKVVTDEDMNDMEWAVVISDHGDEYLIVKTKDKKVYKYGCFVNLKYYPSSDDYFLTKPVMFKDEPTYARTSNEISRSVSNRFFKSDDSWGFHESIKKYSSKESAQWDFDHFLNDLNKIHETSKERYDSRRYHEDEIKRFLVENDIATEENLEKLHNAPWDSRIDGIDGIAGKEDISDENCIDFDHINDVYIVSKDDLEIVQGDEDEYGFPTVCLNFEPDEKLAAEKKLISELGKKWDDWMHGNAHVKLTRRRTVEVDFERLYIDPNTHEALYLIIDSRWKRPKAAYMTAKKVKEVLR